MTQFASMHPADLGHRDRVRKGVHPAFCECGRVCLRIEDHWVEVTTNDTNIILTELREAVVDREGWEESEEGDGPWEFRYQRWLQYVVNGDIEPYDHYPTPAEFDHAERVLRRLIALDKQEAWV